MAEEIRTDNTDTFKNALNKIVELEEENGKLLQRITQLEKDVTENESDCSMCDFPKLKQDLEKQVADLEWQLQEVAKDNDNYQKENKRLEEQLEKMKNRKVFLLQIVDADDYTIDRRFYTTDEEIAKEWDKYDKYNCCFGQAIELEELSNKEQLREELND